MSLSIGALEEGQPPGVALQSSVHGDLRGPGKFISFYSFLPDGRSETFYRDPPRAPLKHKQEKTKT